MSGAFSSRSYLRLRPRSDVHYVSQSHTVLATDRDGFFDRGEERGLYVYQTRLLSTYRWRIAGEVPERVDQSNVEQHSWMGYYMAPPIPAGDEEPVGQPPQHIVEMQLRRFVGDGLHEDVDLINRTQQTVAFELALEVDADFADLQDVSGVPATLGEVDREWRAGDGELAFDWHAGHDFDHQSERGHAELHRAVTLRIEEADSRPSFDDGRIRFDVRLEPDDSWHACVDVIPTIDGEPFPPLYHCGAFSRVNNDRDVKRDSFFHYATDFEAPGSDDLSYEVVGALEQAKRDLISLRLYDLDKSETEWTPAAGLPVYVNLFGRDTLTTAWQSAMLSYDMLRGTLEELAAWQGTEVNDWREEQPGRMLHQARRSPTAELNYTPYGRHYGAMTTSSFYPVTVSELWHWTGDKAAVEPLIEPALRAIDWLDEYGDLDDDGFYEYVARSQMPQKNQSWKDSGEAIVYADGRQVPNPIATCEEQGFAYAAKLHMSEVLWWFDRRDRARELYREARELKERFHEAFWMDEEGYYAMALDPDKRPVRSIASNSGHCLATGIAEASRVERVVERMFEGDLFSGWGVRTLSADHPAYNPISYQRGTVWPVEQATFALGLTRYGYPKHLQMLARSQFDLAGLFDFNRLPECVGGHPRRDDTPFPAIYPEANWPQAWSASALALLVQSMLGMYPFAPLDILIVDPHLPDWFPELTIREMRVGEAEVDLRFWRGEGGVTDYEVLDKRGDLHVIRQPSPWSLRATFAERARDLLQSLVK